jgi:hypothetical protein
MNKAQATAMALGAMVMNSPGNAQDVAKDASEQPAQSAAPGDPAASEGVPSEAAHPLRIPTLRPSFQRQQAFLVIDFGPFKTLAPPRTYGLALGYEF